MNSDLSVSCRPAKANQRAEFHCPMRLSDVPMSIHCIPYSSTARYRSFRRGRRPLRIARLDLSCRCASAKFCLFAHPGPRALSARLCSSATTSTWKANSKCMMRQESPVCSSMASMRSASPGHGDPARRQEAGVSSIISRGSERLPDPAPRPNSRYHWIACDMRRKMRWIR